MMHRLSTASGRLSTFNTLGSDGEKSVLMVDVGPYRRREKTRATHDNPTGLCNLWVKNAGVCLQTVEVLVYKQDSIDESERRRCRQHSRRSRQKRFSAALVWNLQFRADAFNLFNQANFANPNGVLTSANFGRATQMLSNGLGGLSPLFQIGGPRSLQLALKLQF